MQTDSIRILNLNIWNYNPPWATRRERIVDLILDTQPDAVALQEIRYRDWSIDPRHQADQILAGLEGYAAVWAPAHYWSAGSGHNVGELEWEGLTLLVEYYYKKGYPGKYTGPPESCYEEEPEEVEVVRVVVKGWDDQLPAVLKDLENE